MMDNRKTKKDFFLISLTYFLSQGMILFVSGRWWDDWCNYRQSTEALLNEAMQLGRPSVFVYLKFSQLFPENGYRIITFFLFYLGGLLFWGILRKGMKLDARSSLLITLLYVTFPTNDGRIVQAMFPYSIGLFFFLAGFYVLIWYLESNTRKRSLRMIDWMLFFVSFTLNSALMLYMLPLLYILFHERKVKKILKYFDYILVPIFYFVGKTIFFPAYGIYENYNQVTVTIKGLIKTIFNTILADMHIVKHLLWNFISCFKYVFPIIIIAVFLMNYKRVWKAAEGLWKRKMIEDIQQEQVMEKRFLTKNIMLLIVGFMTLTIGLFPYVMIRGTYAIACMGVSGRDSVLVALGGAITIFALIELFFRKEWVNYIYAAMILSGCIFFNQCYMEYQKNWYEQLALQYQLEQHEEVKECKNIVYITENADDWGGMARFYTLNGIAEEAYGGQDRFVANGFSDYFHILQNINTRFKYVVDDETYHMADYDISYGDLDAVIVYTDIIGKKATINLKIQEIFNHKKFVESLKEKSSLKVMLAGTEKFEQRLEAEKEKFVGGQ